MILGERIERKVYVNQQNFVPDIQVLIKHSFLLSFLHENMSVAVLYRTYKLEPRKARGYMSNTTRTQIL